MDNACRRLARVSNKTASSTKRSDSPESFAINYFSNNPDIPLDKRSPQEKLKEFNSKLRDLDLEDNDRFNILVQKKAICSLAYGDDSPETFEALVQLGSFYNSQNRPESAIRHLQKAQEVSTAIDVTDDQKFEVSVELAEAYVTIKPQTKSESNRNLTNAENIFKPYEDYEAEDQMLRYRMNMIKAKIKVRRQKYADAFTLYEHAYEDLDAANKGKTTEQTASLFIEMGDCAESGGDPKTAVEMYQRAYDTFIDLGMKEAAKLIEPKLKSLQKQCAKDDSSSNMNLSSSSSSSDSSSSSSSKKKSRSSSKMRI
ncbi:hypothetical protein TRFO_02928 [Tritrichomonas foetus]|uniref:TPR Domain containing protein n=1 Tax=Tritrichomonas foetus TaxID=1144522 RepID=A0A1J4L0S3_9EUKA|nr:hypothetical protein TRFO_02928 [Tritrichomonas foetus]|eukprot:OHT15574.1 hypothetical protein TRFO_02928 [Tritrichomonas foetus]